VLKDAVNPHVECLRGWRNFCEGVTNVGVIDALVLQSAKSEGRAQAGLFRAKSEEKAQSGYSQET
jgi:hypothetical protein